MATERLTRRLSTMVSASRLRIHMGAGYRVYCGRQGKALVILLCGGDKRSQGTDIKHAKAFWSEWKRRQS